MDNTVPVKIADDDAFTREVSESTLPVLVEIMASWSGSCHIMEPVIQRMVTLFENRIKVCIVDMDTNENIARDYGVSELPILLFFKAGVIKDHVIGPISSLELETRLKSLLCTEGSN